MKVINSFIDKHKRGKTDEVEVVMQELSYNKVQDLFDYILGKQQKNEFGFLLIIKLISDDIIVEKYSPSYCNPKNICSVPNIYIKTRRNMMYVSPGTRINYKTEIPAKTVPNGSSTTAIRILARFSFQFPEFTCDLSFVRHINVDKFQNIDEKLKSEVNTFVQDVIGGKKVNDISDVRTIIKSFIPRLVEEKYGRYEFEIEVKNSKIKDKQLLTDLVRKGASTIKLTTKDILSNITAFGKKLNLPQGSLRNEVVDMHMEDLYAIASSSTDENGWAISYKKDGVRTSIYIDDIGNLILMQGSVPFSFSPSLSNPISKLYYTLIDSEFIEETGTYYLFDISLFDGKEVTGHLKDRIKLLNDVIKKYFQKDILETIDPFFSDKTFTIGDFHFPSKDLPLDKIATNLLNKAEEQPFEIDGLIYTPISGTYNETILRWKFKHTIDFLVQKDTSSKKRGRGGVYNLYCYVPYKSEVTYRGENIVTFPSKYGDMKFAKFVGLATPQKLESKTPLIDHGIYELQYSNKGKWEVLRDRNEKGKPNFYNVAADIFMLMQNPIKSNQIMNFSSNDGKEISYYSTVPEGPILKVFKQFINWAKGEIMSNFYPTNINDGRKDNKIIKIHLTDIGAGRSNDIHKWKSRNVEKVFAIEPDKNAMNVGIQRVSEQHKVDVEYINSDVFTVINDQSLRQKIKPGSQDIVEAFFSSHYFLDDGAKYLSYMKFVASLLKTGGKYITVEINGNSLYKWFQMNGKLDTILDKEGEYLRVGRKSGSNDPSEYLYYIRKEELKKTGKFKIGTKVITSISTINPAKENLVDFDILINAGERAGLKLVQRIGFTKLYDTYLVGRKQNTKITNASMRNVMRCDEALVFVKK